MFNLKSSQYISKHYAISHMYNYKTVCILILVYTLLLYVIYVYFVCLCISVYVCGEKYLSLLNDLRWNPSIHMIKGENNSWKFSTDFHMCDLAWT